MIERKATAVPAARLEFVIGRILDFYQLMKPNIVLLLVITTYCAMVVAYRGLPPIGLTLRTLLGLALSSGSANAINMWYDRDIDRVMRRTQGRPIPAGRMAPHEALIFGIVGEAASIALLGFSVNWLAALASFAGFAYYVFIYTMWLKRTTPQNIVVGGGAGAIPPIVGWAAATGSISAAAWLMFLIVFLWTPPHFWSLALYKQDDYRRAGVPMMPVARGPQTTKRQMIGYAAALLAASVALYFTGTVGPVYLATAVAAGAVFLWSNICLLREQPPETTLAKRNFRISLLYLGVVFFAMVLPFHR